MHRVGWRSRNSIVLSSFMLALLACSDGTNSTDATKLAADGKFQCVAPDCCVPLDIYASKIILHRRSDDIGLDIIVGVPSAANLRWTAEVEATLSWGAPVICTGTFSSSTQGFVGLSCPSLPLDGAPACGAMAGLRLRPATSTTQDPIGKQILCAGQGRSQVELPVPLTCPSCPSSIQPYDPCDAPGGTCSYQALTSTNTWGSLPCFCQMSVGAGEWRWNCAVP